MKLPSSNNVANQGPDAMAMAAARLPGTDQRSNGAMGSNGTHLSSKGSQAIIFAPGHAGTSAADKVEPAGRA